jgi:hypothetical protein
MPAVLGIYHLNSDCQARYQRRSSKYVRGQAPPHIARYVAYRLGI